MHLGEAKLDAEIEVETQILAADEKRLHFFHSLLRLPHGQVLATAEQMMLHVDTKSGRVVPATGAVLAGAKRLAEAHAALARPASAGRHVGARRG
jgi:carnitine 3-dehydrogenase